jgi:hypothetical protein
MFAKMSIKKDMDGVVAEWSNVPESKSVTIASNS